MSAHPEGRLTPSPKRSIDAIAFDLVMLGFLVALALSLPKSESARLVPTIILVPTLLGVAYQLYADLTPWRHPEDAAREEVPRDEQRRQLVFTVWTLSFFVLAWLTSFLLAIPLALFAIFRFINRESLVLSLALAGGFWAFIYVLFALGLGIRF